MVCLGRMRRRELRVFEREVELSTDDGACELRRLTWSFGVVCLRKMDLTSQPASPRHSPPDSPRWIPRTSYANLYIDPSSHVT